MKIDPTTNQVLLDYATMTEKFGFLDFGEFIALWHAADALMASGLEVGLEPQDVPDLLLTIPE
ncbi:MAG: hypothetical protein AABO58_00885 [Acidobacteriota bacterium]